MGTAERRRKLMIALCRRRHDTIENLAAEFCVSERTIRRDIDILSLTEPIYTKKGRYEGGVYVADNYYIDRMYMETEEINLLGKIESLAKDERPLSLSSAEVTLLQKIIGKYTKPTTKGRKI